MTDVTAFLERLSTDPAGSFAEVFLVGDATGARVVQRDEFLQALPARARLFADAGVGTPALTATTVTSLDERYVLARGEWTAERRGGEPVQLVSSYLLHRDANGLRVVAYLNHQGLEAGPAPRRQAG